MGKPMEVEIVTSAGYLGKKESSCKAARLGETSFRSYIQNRELNSLRDPDCSEVEQKLRQEDTQ